MLSYHNSPPPEWDTKSSRYLYERGTFNPGFKLLDIVKKIAFKAPGRKNMLIILGEICRARALLQSETNQP